MGSKHRIVVLGGSGPTGRQIVAKALEGGHTVTAIARRPERLAIQHPSLTAVAADVAAKDQALSRVLPGHDVVISALGRGQALRSQSLIARAAPSIVSAMEGAKISRLVFVSAYGVGGTAPQEAWYLQLVFRVILANIYADKAIGEAIISRSALNWTILAPVILTDQPGTGRYSLREDLSIRGFARISRADVADGALRCMDDPASFRKRLVVAQDDASRS